MTTYTTASLAQVEHHLGKSISAIIAEANSADGLSLRTLTALRAAQGFQSYRFLSTEAASMLFAPRLEAAAADIDARGAAAVAGEVGAALAQYVEAVLAERA